MASLVLKLSVLLGGYVAPIDGSTDWVAAGRSDDGASWTVQTVSNAGAYLMGATTYAGCAPYWPGASGPFAKAMNEIPKVVFSNSLGSADRARRRSPPETWRSHHAAQAGALRRIPARPRRGTVRPSLVETGLMDDYRLLIHPAIVGAGERIFLAPLTMEPMRTIVFSGGAVAHVFAAHP